MKGRDDFSHCKSFITADEQFKAREKNMFYSRAQKICFFAFFLSSVPIRLSAVMDSPQRERPSPNSLPVGANLNPLKHTVAGSAQLSSGHGDDFLSCPIKKIKEY